MPFDPTPLETHEFADEIAIVDRMQQMLALSDNWAVSYQVIRWDNGHTAHCLIGALRAVQSDNPGKLANKYTTAGAHVARVMRKKAGGSIMFFNDTSSHRDVLNLLSEVRRHFESVPPPLALTR